MPGIGCQAVPSQWAALGLINPPAVRPLWVAAWKPPLEVGTRSAISPVGARWSVTGCQPLPSQRAAEVVATLPPFKNVPPANTLPSGNWVMQRTVVNVSVPTPLIPRPAPMGVQLAPFQRAMLDVSTVVVMRL
ncbi:MAG: hypothetical protein MUC36_29645 [Planctomycetes bacterium]|nr:hypothetical protein [Planctomycetota bacterium]